MGIFTPISHSHRVSRFISFNSNAKHDSVCSVNHTGRGRGSDRVCVCVNTYTMVGVGPGHMHGRGNRTESNEQTREEGNVR